MRYAPGYNMNLILVDGYHSPRNTDALSEALSQSIGFEHITIGMRSPKQWPMQSELIQKTKIYYGKILWHLR